jgi:serine/threonine protein kinase
VVQVAPEVTNRGLYTHACDVWSLGIMLYRMLFDKEPYSSFEEAADALTLPFPADVRQTVSSDALNLVTAMLKHDPLKRLTVSEVCSQLPPFHLSPLRSNLCLFSGGYT